MDNKTTKWERLRNVWESSPTARNILKVSIGDITSKVFSIATIFWLIRGLTISDYAAFTTFSGISVLFSGLVGAGINMALVRFSSDALSRGREKPFVLYALAIFIQLILYFVIAGLCLLFPTQSATLLMGEPSFAKPLQLGLLAGLGTLIIQFIRSLFQAEEKFNSYIGVLWVIQLVIFTALALLWFLRDLSFPSAALTFITTQLGIGLWILLSQFKTFKTANLSSTLAPQKNDLAQFVSSSGWLIGYFLILSIISRTDILMLARFSDKEELAIYGVAFQYYSLALLFLGSVHAVLLPKFSKAEIGNVAKQKAFVSQWLQWSMWLIIPIILFDWLGKSFFVWASGIQYEKSFGILVVFSLGIWLSMMFSPLVSIIVGKGNFRFLFLLSVAALGANIVLNLLLVPSLGGIGAAIVVVSSIGIINIFSFIKLQATKS